MSEIFAEKQKMLTFDHEQESKFDGATGSRRGDGLVDFGGIMPFQGQINYAMIVFIHPASPSGG